ncbi:trehalose-6-phosphate synthase [Denitromonas sp.]|uniref:trehalose-6-phosphate synthase n=1 Tax=Denitromonas sp. TaxID=2734609 RepID=UPI003A8A65A9
MVLRGAHEGFSDALLGLMGSSYFVGVLLGALLVPSLVRQMSHIRAVAFFTAAVTASVLAHLMLIDPVAWIGLGAHPVGLDVGRIEKIWPRKQRTSAWCCRWSGSTTPLHKLEAFERLLDNHPEFHGKVTLVTVCVPAAREMTIYRELQSQIEQAVGRINGRFSTVGWTPLQFFFRPLPFDEVVSYYAMADVMWITPLRDGLNLVAKEYVATQGLTQGHGVLVLSEFAGVAAELHGTLLTNPHDPSDMEEKIYLGLTLGGTAADPRGPIREQFGIVCHNTVQHWGEAFIAAVNETTGSTTTAAAPGEALSQADPL